MATSDRPPPLLVILQRWKCRVNLALFLQLLELTNINYIIIGLGYLDNLKRLYNPFYCA